MNLRIDDAPLRLRLSPVICSISSPFHLVKCRGSPERAILYHRALEKLSFMLAFPLRVTRHTVSELNTMAWTLLVIAGLFEICWAIGLKYTDGFSRFWPTVGTVVAMAASFGCLAQALKSIPVGTGYAVWTGIGAAGTFLVGIVFFGDAGSLGRYLGVLLIISGVVVLKLSH